MHAGRPLDEHESQVPRRNDGDQAGTHATFFGNATVNGVATYRIDVDDLAEPGAGRDTFKIQTANGYTVGGVLLRGNIQVHK